MVENERKWLLWVYTVFRTANLKTEKASLFCRLHSPFSKSQKDSLAASHSDLIQICKQIDMLTQP